MNSLPAPPALNSASSVNYDSPALVELELDGVDYRVDGGKQGTALCISSRITGSWDWAFAGEARWDARSLRSKLFPRVILEPLSAALARALADAD